APNLITGAAKILDVPADLITPCLDELAAAEGVVREQVPAAGPSAQAEAAPQVPAVYLPPFYQAERSLASALLRLHAARPDRLARQAARRTGPPRRGHHPPAAATPPGRRPVLRRRPPAGRGPGGGRRDLHGRRHPGQQTRQGGPAGRAPAARRRRRPAALSR